MKMWVTEVGGHTAQRNVTRFPRHSRIYRIAPDAFHIFRIRISTVVHRCRHTPVGKTVVSEIEFRDVVCVRWPGLTLLARRRRTDGSSVSTTCFCYSTLYSQCIKQTNWIKAEWMYDQLSTMTPRSYSILSLLLFSPLKHVRNRTEYKRVYCSMN